MSSKPTSIRIPNEKLNVYDRFKEIVIEEQHSDICYVLTSLMEAYNAGYDSSPDPNKEITLIFPKQNIQLNIGCNFNYIREKSRRIAPPETIQKEKNLLLPMFIEQYATLNAKAKIFWKHNLEETLGWLILEKNEVSLNRQKEVSKKPRSRVQKHYSAMERMRKFVKRFRKKFHRK